MQGAKFNKLEYLSLINPLHKTVLPDNSDGSNYVGSLMFDRSKPKIGCLSSITKR